MFTSDNSKAKGQENYSVLEEVCPLAGFPPETLHSVQEKEQGKQLFCKGNTELAQVKH